MEYISRLPYQAVHINARENEDVLRFGLDEPWVEALRQDLHRQRSEELGIDSRPDNKETFAVADERGHVRFVQFYDFHCTIGESVSVRSEPAIRSMRRDERQAAQHYTTLRLPDVGGGFDLNNWIEENREDKAAHVGTFTNLMCPEIKCADGFEMSVQASEHHCATPRSNYPDEYDRVEVGFPNEREDRLMEHIEVEDEDPTESIYPYVPVETVEEIVEAHGGLAS